MPLPEYRKLTDAKSYRDPDGAPYEDIVRSIVAYIIDLPAELHDFVYDSDPLGGTCSYRPDDHNPNGCIVGWAASQTGLDPSKFGGTAADALHEALKIPGAAADAPATAELYLLLDFLEVVQEEQDTGASWGACSDRLKELIRRNVR